MAYTGTEEMARFAPGFNYTGGDHQNYLRQLNRFGDTDLELIRERGAEDARHELAYQDRLGQAIGAGYQGYRQGKRDAYDYAQAEENLATSRLQNQDAASEMEAKNKIYDPNQAPGALSGREFSYYNQGTNAANNQLGYGQNKAKMAWSEEKGADGRTNLARGLDQDFRIGEENIKGLQTNRQIAQANMQNQNFAAEDRRIQQAASVIRAQAKDSKTGAINPQAAQQIAAAHGLDPTKANVAMAMAAQSDSQQAYMNQLLDPGFQPFQQRVGTALAGLQELQNMAAEAKGYKQAAGMQGRLFDSSGQSDTRRRVAQMFADRGKPEIAREILSSVPDVGRGAYTADEKMAMYLKDEIGEIEREIAALKSNPSYSHTPNVQNLVRELEMVKNDIDQLGSAQATKKNVLDLFSPQQKGPSSMANQQFFQPQATGMAGMPQPMQQQPGQPMNFRHHSVGQQQVVNQAPGMPPAQVQPQFAPGAFQNLPNQNRGGM